MIALVRRAALGDAGSLHRAWQALRLHNANVDPRIVLGHVSEGEFLGALRDSLSRRSALFLVAVDGEDVVGFATATIEENQPDRLPERHVTVGSLFVLPAFRRQGIAGELLADVERWAADEAGVDHIEMPVLAADQEAGGFWRAHGFSPFIVRLWKPLEPDPGA